MKNFNLFLLLASLACISCSKQVEEEPIVDYDEFKIQRGTNIAHWLSQSKRRGSDRAAFFTEKDVALIDSLGFDHIRLPVDEEQLWDEEGNRNDGAFTLLDEFLGWAQKRGLRVILDLHILRSHHFNNDIKPLWNDPKEQQKFIALWKDLSSAVSAYPTGMLAYEFMNEPVADDPEQWNDLLATVADSIRSWEAERTLVIGSNRWQSANTFDQLRIPANDPNILLSFHFYEPFMLTHYQASWTDLRDFEGVVQYPGQIVRNPNNEKEARVYNRDTLEKMMAKPLHLADSLNLPLYCGEFGIIDGTPEVAKMAWYEDMVAIFEKNNIAYANWNYKSGSFGIVNIDMEPKKDLVKVLGGRMNSDL